ncbi:ethanolamine ammonia-lyase subunit EutC [Vagococcus intermedius]|uniref:Ethanolamine ammonia-lyase small subunit n=2 Tax=Vagococcus intermedius TaxID=2991418 RepID=A0AAF0I764_9ENTE|nr:ethanolamine ammonia-lyase subunit EutC [Vagococcus intermedius]WEG72781.1 ethanolamine ammonia-lyase subunit EutC [Vagococcus intermedius]WEG74866.1 ethanolamine ammonia-lyase subunit EutC [Vagococcus intermedius]
MVDEKSLKAMIESILTEMSGQEENTAGATETQTQATVATPATTPTMTSSAQESDYNGTVEDAFIPDITEVNIKEQFLIPNAADKEGYLRMKQYTPARLGLWRSGPRYKTQSMLRFRADHAAAQDAVFSDVPEELVKEMGFVAVQTMCKDKDEYVTRPDLGRQFDAETREYIKANTTKGAKVQVMVGDGLSSAAVGANIKEILPSIKQGLKMFNLDFNEVVFVKYSRVATMDEIGELTDADVVCMLIGERPGLVTAESMSAYLAYKPTVGMPEARRTVISNIQKGGTPAVEAGAYIAELIKEMLEKKKSGIDLKEG